MTVGSTIRHIRHRHIRHRQIRQTQRGQGMAGGAFAGSFLAAVLIFSGAVAREAHSQLAEPAQNGSARRLPSLALPEGGLPSGYVGLPFHTSVAVVGGSGLYSILASGDLPEGVVLVRGGGTLALSGVPTAAGDFQLSVSATDLQGGGSTSHTYEFHIAQQLLKPEVMTSPLAVTESFHLTDVDHVYPPALINVVENLRFTDSDGTGVPPIADRETFHLTDTVLVGMGRGSFNTEVFHFNDAVALVLSPILHVTENFRLTDTVAFVLSPIFHQVETFTLTDTVALQVKVGITPATAPAGNNGSAYSQAFTVAGATATGSLTFNGAPLPTGLSFNCNGATCTLSGTPTQAGTFPFTLTAKDTSGATVRSSTTVSYTLVINGRKQTIDFPQPNGGVVNRSAMLTATATSGLPVTFSIVSGPATLSGTNNATITFTGTGEVIVAADQAGNATYAAAPTVQDPIDSEIVNYVWLVNSTGTVTKIVDRGMLVGTVGAAGAVSTKGGVAIDSAGNAWTVSAGNDKVVMVNSAASAATNYTAGGISGPAAVAIDGVGSVWVANMTGNSVLEFTNAGAPLSPANGYTAVTPGYAATGYAVPAGIAIDISGNVWVTNPTKNAVIEILGGAAPVVPLVTGVTNYSTGSGP